MYRPNVWTRALPGRACQRRRQQARTPIASWRVILGERAWSRRVGVILYFVLAWFTQPLWAGQFKEIVVFGESSADTGNVFAATGNTFPDPNYYFQGRWSNGPMWPERLASNLGVPDPTPSLLGVRRQVDRVPARHLSTHSLGT
jgi:hypothetical protein